MGFEISEKAQVLNVQLEAFMEKHIYPREHDMAEWCLDQDNLWQTPPWFDELREQAKAEGHEVVIYKTAFKPMKHTLSERDERTVMKLVVDEATDKVLGVHMCGADAPEIVQGFAVALKAGATKAEFDDTIGIHPTSAEEFVTMRHPFEG